MGEDKQVREYFSRLDLSKSIGPDEMYLQVLRELNHCKASPSKLVVAVFFLISNLSNAI